MFSKLMTGGVLRWLIIERGLLRITLKPRSGNTTGMTFLQKNWIMIKMAYG